MTEKRAVFGKGPALEARETAVVVSTDGESAKVQLQHISACEACGSSMICFPESGRLPTIDARNQAGAAVGDTVMLQREESPRIAASLIVFGLPVATLLAGAATGGISGSDTQGGAVVGGIVGLALGILLVRLINQLVRRRSSLKPSIRRIIKAARPIENPATGRQP